MRNKRNRLKVFVAVLAAIAVFGAGALFGALNKPTSVIHVVTLKWKEGATQAQIGAALKGVETVASKYPGIKNVWTRSIKAQGMDAAFVMEFASEQALKDYADSAAQKEWYEVYIPVRDTSRTFDITN
jgi:hypothetical protein